MYKESNARKGLNYSKGVKAFIGGLFLATLLFMVFFVYIVKSACF